MCGAFQRDPRLDRAITNNQVALRRLRCSASSSDSVSSASAGARFGISNSAETRRLSWWASPLIGTVLPRTLRLRRSAIATSRTKNGGPRSVAPVLVAREIAAEQRTDQGWAAGGYRRTRNRAARTPRRDRSAPRWSTSPSRRKPSGGRANRGNRSRAETPEGRSVRSSPPTPGGRCPGKAGFEQDPIHHAEYGRAGPAPSAIAQIAAAVKRGARRNRRWRIVGRERDREEWPT